VIRQSGVPGGGPGGAAAGSCPCGAGGAGIGAGAPAGGATPCRAQQADRASGDAKATANARAATATLRPPPRGTETKGDNCASGVASAVIGQISSEPTILHGVIGAWAFSAADTHPQSSKHRSR